MKIDLLIGDNSYKTAKHFAKGLAGGLKRAGATVRLFWIEERHFFHAFYEILNDPPDFTCSFADIRVGDQPFGNCWHIPHFCYLVDPPIYFLHQLSGKKNWISCVDHNDCDFVKVLGFPRVFFLPHGVSREELTPIDRERPYDVVFFGTCIDYEKVAQQWAKKERELLLEASERVLSTRGLSIAQALFELDVEGKEFARFHAEVDSYTRGKDRVELIKSLKGHKVHIWGEGPWNKYLGEQHQDRTLHKPISFSQTLKIMKESKVVLNSSPRFKCGSHERIFYALACGAAVCTGQTPYLQKELPTLFTYQFGQWDNQSFNDWHTSAQVGQEHVLTHHTWDVRAQTLIQMMQAKNS